jgi:hypothetical protein
MLSTFSCKHSSLTRCPDSHTTDPGEVIAHLQLLHVPTSIRRPYPHYPDPEGNIWYCYACKGKSGRKCRKYRSNQAMWDHINARHKDWLADVAEASDWVVI